MVQGHGVNDMPGWFSESEENKKVYEKWYHMLERCYDEKWHKKYPTYIGCTVCERWLLLSNFVEDFKLIDGYNEEKFLNNQLVLDKDVKSNGQNKCYCLENCMLVSKSENSKQANKTRDYTQFQSENNPRSVKIVQYDKQGNLIKIWNSAMDIERSLGISNGNIITCCKFWEINCNKEKWYKTHKNNPYKSTGGFVFKYYTEEENEKNE